jgi:carboxymethylenebutenolidase
MLHFSELNKRVNKFWRAYEKLLKKVRHELPNIFYLGVNHRFHNDSTSRYNKNPLN